MQNPTGPAEVDVDPLTRACRALTAAGVQHTATYLAIEVPAAGGLIVVTDGLADAEWTVCRYTDPSDYAEGRDAAERLDTDDLTALAAWVAQRTFTSATPGAAPVCDLTDLFGPLIHVYTRAQAIADDVLHDVTTDAAEAGFRCPVALTAAAWGDAVEWNAEHGAHQDESGRLWDVLTMARFYAQRASGTDRVPFRVLRVPNQPHATQPRHTDLVLHIGPGDHGEPVFTIMLPDED